MFAFVASTWERNYGYKKGEGRLTEREGGGHYGVSIDETSDNDISRNLGYLAKTIPPAFTELIGRKYDLTISEGETLRTILFPAMKILEEFEEIKAVYKEDPNNEEVLHILGKSMEILSATVGPVVMYLQQFPRKRVKVIKKI